MLQEPGDQGGFVLPDWQKYYLPGQMVYACRWLLSDDEDATMVLEAAHLRSYESLKLALFRGTKIRFTINVVNEGYDKGVGCSG